MSRWAFETTTVRIHYCCLLCDWTHDGHVDWLCCRSLQMDCSTTVNAAVRSSSAKVCGVLRQDVTDITVEWVQSKRIQREHCSWTLANLPVTSITRCKINGLSCLKLHNIVTNENISKKPGDEMWLRTMFYKSSKILMQKFLPLAEL